MGGGFCHRTGVGLCDHEHRSDFAGDLSAISAVVSADDAGDFSVWIGGGN